MTVYIALPVPPDHRCDTCKGTGKIQVEKRSTKKKNWQLAPKIYVDCHKCKGGKN